MATVAVVARQFFRAPAAAGTAVATVLSGEAVVGMGQSVKSSELHAVFIWTNTYAWETRKIIRTK